MNIMRQLELEHMKSSLPDFGVGDTVDVHYRIVEGDKERIQVFQGVLIGMKGRGINRTATLALAQRRQGRGARTPYEQGALEAILVLAPKTRPQWHAAGLTAEQKALVHIEPIAIRTLTPLRTTRTPHTRQQHRTRAPPWHATARATDRPKAY